MINIIMRLLGLGKAVDALDGQTSKAYIGGVGQILSGAAAVLGASANLVGEVLPLHGADDYLAFAKNVSHDPSVAALLAGIGLIHLGIAAIGNRHAMAKLAASEVASQPQAHQ